MLHGGTRTNSFIVGVKQGVPIGARAVHIVHLGHQYEIQFFPGGVQRYGGLMTQKYDFLHSPFKFFALNLNFSYFPQQPFTPPPFMGF